jgi:uncharacterized protein YuzE
VEKMARKIISRIAVRGPWKTLEVAIYVDPKAPATNAIYFRVRKGKVASTHEVGEWAMADYDEAGKLLGLEMLEPGHVTVKDMNTIAEKCSEPCFADIRPDKLLQGVGV